MLQIMAAERDFLESKFKRSTGRQQELVGHIQVLRRQLLGAGLHPEVAAVRLQAPDDASVASDDTADASGEDAYRFAYIHLWREFSVKGCLSSVLVSNKARLWQPTMLYV